MSAMTEADGSEDVNDFLRRIRELGDKRDREDEERTRRLEEEILQGRRERQARRAGVVIRGKEVVLTRGSSTERARSISPVKDSPTNTPLSARSSFVEDASDVKRMSSPANELNRPTSSQREAVLSDTLGRLNGSRTPTQENRDPNRGAEPTKGLASPVRSSPSNSIAFNRPTTASWQRRPGSSQSQSPHTRPLSAIASENNASRSPKAMPERTESGDVEITRHDIAHSLGSKDPSWFKQTADRAGSTSQYYRPSSDEKNRENSNSQRMRLPGLSRESTAEPGRPMSPSERSPRSPSFTPTSSLRETEFSTRSTHQSSMTSNATRASPERASPFPTLHAQKFEPPSREESPTSSPPPTSEGFGVNRMLSKSHSSGRISPDRFDRAPSPTKGLGGFVQSAMLKRSDSVTKRWSAQNSPGLSRGNSTVGARPAERGSISGLPGFGSPPSPSKAEHRPSSLSRETSPVPRAHERSSATPTPLRGGEEEEKALSVEKENKPEEKPNVTNEAKATVPTFTGERISRADSRSSIRTPSTSPGKHVEHKRWSPTKSSWLETALSRKPESPTKSKPATPNQPSWMADINKAKKEKASGTLSHSTSSDLKKTPVSTKPNPPEVSGISADKNESTSSVKPASPEIPTKSVNLERYMNRQSEDKKEPKAQSPQLAKANALKEDTKTLERQSTDKSSPQLETEPKPTPVATPSKSSEDISRSPESSAKFSPARDVKETTAQHGRSPSKPDQKPKTPPKKDFRSNLKPSSASTMNKNQDQPEFKQVFGNLRRTQTKNYVAPDPLKENILRGKAGLNASEGPQHNNRKDELKESLIQQRQSMKENASKQKEEQPEAAPKPADALTPEALSRQRTLSKSQSRGSVTSETQSTTPEAIARRSHMRDNSRKISPEKPTAPSFASSSVSSTSSGKLAGRFNPGLAAMIARGPPATSNDSNTSKSPDEAATQGSNPLQSSTQSKASSEAGGKLTHMTKGRARGPKRRLPAAKAESPITNDGPAIGKTPQAGRGVSPVSAKSSPIDAANESPRSAVGKAPVAVPSNRGSTAQREVGLGIKSPERSVEARSPGLKSSEPPVVEASLPSDDSTTQKSTSQAEFQGAAGEEKPDQYRFSVKRASARWTASTKEKDDEVKSPKSPVRLPTQADEDEARMNAGMAPGFSEVTQKPTRNNRSSSPKSRGPRVQTPPKPASLSKIKSPESPTETRSNVTLSPSKAKPPTTDQERPKELPKSSVPPSSEAYSMLADFFDGKLQGVTPAEVNTQSILQTTPKYAEDSAIKTLRGQIWEITGGGKQLQMPSNQEHILYDGSMYVCSHVFGTANGTRTNEVYFWYGDEVSEAAVQDAQLFAKKIARQNETRLISFQQGCESSKFFQALGGIAIFRKGSSSRGNSQGPFMLCGRRHLGQIAFDEVEMSPQNLCSGFPYIISAKDKIYLWKGKGSRADEIGSARLIGMDLGLTGEIYEIDEGTETASFYQVFQANADRSEAAQSENWQLKSKYDNYRPRLFRVDHQTGAKVQEIEPFTQADLNPSHIYCLDGFFDFHILLGSFAQSKLPEFLTALKFGEEYGILASSMEDRPFVPKGTVVVKGIPQDVKATFRKWTDRRASAHTRTVPLEAAVEAMKG